MANISSVLPTIGLNGTVNTSDGGGQSCGPPPGWTGLPPPGVYANAATMLYKILTPIIILSGTFGNGLTVAVLFRHSKKLSSTGLFLLCLAVSDTALLYTAPLRRWILAMWKYDIRHLGVVGCKFSVYLTYCSVQFSSFILIAVTIERLISVVLPHRVRLVFTKRNSALFILAFFVGIFGLNTHILYGFGHSKLKVHGKRGFCEPQYEGYLYFWEKIYAFIDFAVAFAIPCTIIIVANGVILQKLTQARSLRKDITSKKSNSPENRSVSVMLVTLGVLFFIFMVPVSVYFIYSPYWNEENRSFICTDVYEYIRRDEVRSLVYAIVTILSYGNAAVNFYLYVLSGSRFRAQIKALLLCEPVGKECVFGSSSSNSSQRRQQTVFSDISSVDHTGLKSKPLHDDDIVCKTDSFDHANGEVNEENNVTNPATIDVRF